MTGKRDGTGYQGFDDANDFLPDDFYEEEPQEDGGRRRDTRVHTGARRMRPFPKILLTILAVALVGVVLNETLMKIRHVRVIGNRSIPAETIAVQAGMNRDMSLLFVDEARIRSDLERNAYLQFLELRRIFPDTLVLIVKERAPCANVQGAGALYLVDENAFVLQSFDTITAPNTLPVVIGMQVSEARPGRKIGSNRSVKVDEYCLIMQEMLLQGIVGEYREINLTDSNHVYLKHQDGFMAELGTVNELMAKIGTLRAVVTELQGYGLRNGYIDVSIPGEAIYTPE